MVTLPQNFLTAISSTESFLLIWIKSRIATELFVGHNKEARHFLERSYLSESAFQQISILDNWNFPLLSQCVSWKFLQFVFCIFSLIGQSVADYDYHVPFVIYCDSISLFILSVLFEPLISSNCCIPVMCVIPKSFSEITSVLLNEGFLFLFVFIHLAFVYRHRILKTQNVKSKLYICSFPWWLWRIVKTIWLCFKLTDSTWWSFRDSIPGRYNSQFTTIYCMRTHSFL